MEWINGSAADAYVLAPAEERHVTWAAELEGMWQSGPSVAVRGLGNIGLAR